MRLVIARLLVRLSPGALPSSNPGQVVYTRLPLLTKQSNLVPAKGRRLGGLSTCGLNGNRKGDKHSAYTPWGV